MRSRTLRIAAVTAGLILFGPALAADEPATRAAGPVLARAYEIRFRELADAADVVSAVLSPEGTVTLQPKLRTLVVQDRPSVLDRVGALLQSFDLPPRNVEVTLGLFLGTDRRDEEIGRSARPAGPAREVRGVTETLGDVTKWSAYEPLGSRSVVGAEGSRVTADLSEDYRVVLELDSVQEAPGVVRFRSVSLQRISRAADGSEKAENLVTTSVVIPSGRLLVVGAAKGPDSRKALFLTLQAKAR